MHNACAQVPLRNNQPSHKTHQECSEESHVIVRDFCLSDMLELSELKLFRYCNIFLMRFYV